MSDIEIEQFCEAESDGGLLQSWYAFGHHDECEFALALCDYLIDAGEDVPAVRLDKIEKTYMRKSDRIDGSWEAFFEGKKNGWNTEVTIYDAECRLGGFACCVRDCNNQVMSKPGVLTRLEASVDDRLIVDLPLCREHRNILPEPSYRVVMVPVGSEVVLPKESKESVDSVS